MLTCGPCLFIPLMLSLVARSHIVGNWMVFFRPFSSPSFDYDYAVIGGGSGGLASVKAAAQHGTKAVLFDAVSPSIHGSTWGLGGTCVNVGCIPKKIMHTSALLGESYDDMEPFGWKMKEKKTFDWETLVQNTQNHIKSVNYGYRTDLRISAVDYINAHASFKDPHTLEYEEKGKRLSLTAKHILIAVGGRPRMDANVKGKEHCISSDDLFSLKSPPGKTLVIGGGYIALESAGFLHGFGYDTTVMLRSIPLRGFDQQMADKVRSYMEDFMKIKFLHHRVPTLIERLESGRYKVTYNIYDPQTKSMGSVDGEEEFDTILNATGRKPALQPLQLASIGVDVDDMGKILVNEKDQTNIPSIYCVGDAAAGAPELTPFAVQAGKLLGERLFGNSSTLMNNANVPTTVFTPLEYSCVGHAEETAIARFGEENIEVYHMQATPYEQVIIERRGEYPSYLKMIVHTKDNDRVVGLHIASPNAGEIMQGYAIAISMGVTKSQFDQTIGIHPTTSELFTTMNITKRSGKELPKGGCPSCA